MINFIICEDNHLLNKQYQNIIDKICISLNLSYKIHSFFDYDKNFFKMMKSDLSSKFYILDIEANSHKGTEIASSIRTNDFKSFIIFITSYYERYAKDLLENKYMFLKYINKEEDYKNILHNTICGVIKNLDKNHIITIKKKDITYRFQDTDIIYIYYEGRKTHIVTSHYEVDSSKSLKYYYNLLPNHFLYSHKACIVNIDMISKIERLEKKVIFKNGYYTNLLSKNYSKSIFVSLKNKISS